MGFYKNIIKNLFLSALGTLKGAYTIFIIIHLILLIIAALYRHGVFFWYLNQVPMKYVFVVKGFEAITSLSFIALLVFTPVYLTLLFWQEKPDEDEEGLRTFLGL